MLSRRRLATIRAALDVDGYRDTPILSYAAKYASIFYRPFREAAEFGYAWGDRKSYQMNPANFAEALWEVQLDIEEEAGHISYWAKEFASWVCRGLSYGRMPFLWANFFVGEHSFRRGCSLTILKEEIEFDAYR